MKELLSADLSLSYGPHRMAPMETMASIETTAAALHRCYRWCATGAGCSLLLALLVLYLLITTGPVWSWALLSTGVLVLVVRKLVTLHHAHRSAKQVRLEKRFVNHGLEAACLLRCLRSPMHLWQASHTFRGLRRLVFPLDPHRQRPTLSAIRQSYRTALSSLSLPGASLDVGITAVVTIGGAVLDAVSPSVLLALTLVLISEVVQAASRAHMRRLLDRLTRQISLWTLNIVIVGLEHAAPSQYHHTVMYQAASCLPRRAAPLPRASMSHAA